MLTLDSLKQAPKGMLTTAAEIDTSMSSDEDHLPNISLQEVLQLY